jgi:RNA polymerase sigma-70 factor (ECF subfamily)
MSLYFDLFNGCKKGDAKAQRMLYDLFKARLLGLCRRYSRSREEAQDILQESFIKIFSKINQLESSEKLEGWMKAVTVRTAIDHYHKVKTHDSIFFKLETEEMEEISSIAIKDFTDQYLLNIINQLPDGCRLVFNLSVVEGYNHSEIANLLNISEGTSRSQLHHAKHLLKEKLKGQAALYYEKLA